MNVCFQGRIDENQEWLDIPNIGDNSVIDTSSFAFLKFTINVFDSSKNPYVVLLAYDTKREITDQIVTFSERNFDLQFRSNISLEEILFELREIKKQLILITEEDLK